jgi:hypothetical protein
MNAKQQRKIESVQHLINRADVELEISRSETRAASARDSMDDFYYVLTIGFLIGMTEICTAAWYSLPLLRASWNGLLLSLAVFAFFSLYRHIQILRSIRPEEMYKKELQKRRAQLAGVAGGGISQPRKKARIEEEYE